MYLRNFIDWIESQHFKPTRSSTFLTTDAKQSLPLKWLRLFLVGAAKTLPIIRSHPNVSSGSVETIYSSNDVRDENNRHPFSPLSTHIDHLVPKLEKCLMKTLDPHYGDERIRNHA